MLMRENGPMKSKTATVQLPIAMVGVKSVLARFAKSSLILLMILFVSRTHFQTRQNSANTCSGEKRERIV